MQFRLRSREYRAARGCFGCAVVGKTLAEDILMIHHQLVGGDFQNLRFVITGAWYVQ
ncbi:hypothetical protein C2S52_021584 [Perilla frutescens var. hirtella]|nr:hypothetical protein C2S52_021584 [Perilla frutescens var. hirtella]KAH6807983.1 hypothetical protein C2S51_029091 [Perilla frutescens var. frutescens]